LGFWFVDKLEVKVAALSRLVPVVWTSELTIVTEVDVLATGVELDATIELELALAGPTPGPVRERRAELGFCPG
jgi:hypothetical protein